jgi:hypothetical protein
MPDFSGMSMASGAPKTLHITNAYHPASGGVATFYRELLNGANRHERQVRLVVPSDRTAIEEVGDWGRIYEIKAPPSPIFDTRYRLLWPHEFALPYKSTLRQILQHEQPDIIEVCDKYTLCFLPSVIRKGWIRGLRPPALVGMSTERMDDSVAAYLSLGDPGRRFAKWYVRTSICRALII